MVVCLYVQNIITHRKSVEYIFPMPRLLFSHTGCIDGEIVAKQLHNAVVIQLSLMARICRHCEVSYNDVLSALAELLVWFVIRVY